MNSRATRQTQGYDLRRGRERGQESRLLRGYRLDAYGDIAEGLETRARFNVPLWLSSSTSSPLGLVRNVQSACVARMCTRVLARISSLAAGAMFYCGSMANPFEIRSLTARKRAYIEEQRLRNVAGAFARLRRALDNTARPGRPVRQFTDGELLAAISERQYGQSTPQADRSPPPPKPARMPRKPCKSRTSKEPPVPRPGVNELHFNAEKMGSCP